MLTNSNHALYLQIQSLVQVLNNKKASNNAKNELVSLIDSVGVEAEKYTLICLLETTDLKETKNQNTKKEQVKAQFLAQRLSICTDSPGFVDYFAEVMEYISQKHNFVECINDLIKHLKLTIPVQIIMAFSLSQSSNQQISKEGVSLLKKKLTEYFKTGKSFNFSENILNDLLYFIRTSSHFENMKKEVTFLVESNSSGRPSYFRPLLSANPENPETESQSMEFIDEIPINVVKVWEIMKDLGPTCTHSHEYVERLLSGFPSLNEDQILETLLLMSNNPSALEDTVYRAINHTYHAIKTHDWSNLLNDSSTKESNVTWKVNNFLEVCNKKYKVDWNQVIAALDRPNLRFRDPQALVFLFKSFQRFKNVPGFSFPSAILFRRWRNSVSQIEFLTNMIKAGQPDVMFFTNLEKRTISKELYPNILSAALNPASLQFFKSLDILEILIELSESDAWNEIRGLFDSPLEKCPDLLLFSLLEIRPRTGGELLNELYTSLILKYLANYTASMKIFETIWKKKPQVIITAFSDLFDSDTNPLSITAILDILQSIRDSLQAVLDCDDYSFAINLGVAAAKKELINLEEWIFQRIKTGGNEFVSALMEYFKDVVFESLKSVDESQNIEILEKYKLSLESLTRILHSLIDTNTEALSAKNKLVVAELYKELSKYFPEVDNKPPPPTGIDVLANSMIEKVLEGNISVPDLITTLLNQKNSEDEKEKEIAVYIISNLLDESRFFSTYKAKVLTIMAQIYGFLIKNDVIEGKTRDLAFLIILDMVKQKESRKLFDFGINALLVFRERLYEWPQKALQLFYIENLKNYAFELLEQIQFDLETNNVEVALPEEYITLKNQKIVTGGVSETPSRPSSTPITETQPADRLPNNHHSPRQLTLEDIISNFDKEPSEIAEDLKNKIISAVNNINENNLVQKGMEIKLLLRDDQQVLYWFARHIIGQKASKDSVRHELYFQLLEKIGKKEIYNILTKETYTLFSYILANIFNAPEKAVLNGKEKNTIKNLGSWLGSLTIARNKPIIMKEFDIKALLIAAHENKKLDHILPLVCKILIQGNQPSSVFKPNNAWMSAILSILAEIAEMQDIKMALKYEIQMLFRNLGLNDGDITPSKIFRERKLRKKNAAQPQNHQQGSIEAFLNSDELIKSLRSTVTVPKGPSDIDLRTITAQALGTAIRKTLPNVSDASTLALITSKRLVLKDFATEPDEKNLIHGLELTIQSLAENITLVASQRPLTEYFQQALDEQLSKYTTLDNKEKLIEPIITNNLDIGCKVIRNAVVKEALGEANHDPEVLQAVEKRKLARERGSLPYDGSATQIWSSLPDVLKPNPRGLTREEMKIYEGFGNGNNKKATEDN